MPDYMFLLESRMSPEQRAVLLRVQELARAQESNIYLTGGAVRDLISGMPLRDLDFTIEGNPARMLRELEKGGARILKEDERLRHAELIFAGDVDGSISAARDEYYARPGAKPEMRWSTIMEDLRRRDFAINAIAISLNPASRGLLLDPTNGLADLERREVRALSIHAFTNQPARLLRALRFCTRMGFKMESRTQEWFDLALERGLHETIDAHDAGAEILDIGREENPAAILKTWDAKGLLAAVYSKLQRRRPDYDGLSRLARAKEQFTSAGMRVRTSFPAVYYIFHRLGDHGMASALRHLGAPSAFVDRVVHLPAEGKKLLQLLRGSKTKQPRDAYNALAAASTELLVFVDAEFRNPRVAAKIRNYLQKWRPLRMSLPVAELDSLGVPRGPKFDKILEQLFDLQLRGKARTPPDVTKALRQFAGIKEEPKKKVKEEKKTKKADSAEAHPQKAPKQNSGTEKGRTVATAAAAGKKPEPPRKAASPKRPHRKAAARSKKRARR